MSCRHQLLLVLAAAVLTIPASLAAFPGMKGKSPGPIVPGKMPKAPTPQPSSKGGAIYCRVVHFERNDLTSATECETVELQVHNAAGKILKQTLKSPTYVAGFCRFQLPAGSDRSFTCVQTRGGVEYISARAKKLSNAPLLLVVADSTTDTKELRYSSVSIFYQLGESSRSVMGQIQGFLTLTNRGNKTVDCRKQGLRLPLIVPKDPTAYGLERGWSPHTAKKSKVEAMGEKDAVVRGPQGWEFRGVLRPGKSLRVLQTIQTTQSRSSIELIFEPGLGVDGLHLGMPYTRLYTPQLAIDGTTSSQVNSHRRMKLFAISRYNFDGKRAIPFAFGHLPVPSNRGAHVAFYLIVALALAAVLYLVSRASNQSRAAR